jgi:hypothetical protein
MKLAGWRWSLLAGILLAAAAPILFAFDIVPGQNRVWAQFRQPVLFADRLLPEGNYLVVHDDEKSAMGEPCLYVYGENNPTEPLIAVHCIRRDQSVSERVKIVWGNTRGDNLREFGYIQFPGEAFAHYLQ